jgi:CRISPR/Cas system CSM-associated protein Csm3 (group 7 of RAMP superfamily)
MNIRMTVFTGTLVQDSALSISGLDRETAADQSFTIVDGVPVIAGRGLKGAAVAMARRFFEPLPRTVSEDPAQRSALRRSAWEFANARPISRDAAPRLRSGVGILQKTGARAEGALYDREVIPAGTQWRLIMRVDWRLAESEAEEAEGILGYVLSKHWAAGRSWLGGGVARGMGWCHLEDLHAYRLDAEAYETWVRSGRETLPPPESSIPSAAPTRSWCFRTLDVAVRFGEYRPRPEQEAWGIDMLAIGPHGTERGMQPVGTGTWARPAWVMEEAATSDGFSTDCSILMDSFAPLLPGSSVRGPMRHAFSRRSNARNCMVLDPLSAQGSVGDDDPGGKLQPDSRCMRRTSFRPVPTEAPSATRFVC